MSYRVYASKTATIANGEATSSEVTTGGLQPVAVQLPASFSGTSLTFQRAKNAGGTYGSVREVSGAGEYTVPCTAGQYIPLDPWVMLAVENLKIVSNSNEGAAREIEVVCAPIVR